MKNSCFAFLIAGALALENITHYGPTHYIGWLSWVMICLGIFLLPERKR